jgi:xylonate dehydratase
MGELIAGGKIHTAPLTVSGKTVGEVYGHCRTLNRDVIRPYHAPLKENAGLTVVHGNLFHSALLKTSVISADFRRRYLSTPGSENSFTARAIVFDGPEDYRSRIEDPSLAIDAHCMLVIRGAGPIAFPGSAEVVNMSPPGYLVQQGAAMLPCMGDGRQSGTSDSPSILNASPEAAAGGGLAILQTGDAVRIDLTTARVDVLLSEEEISRRYGTLPNGLVPPSQSPWQELYRKYVGQLETGACLDFATEYHNLREIIPRHSH